MIPKRPKGDKPSDGKLYPAYEDTDKMPFGKAHKGKMLQDVPANYLHFLWTKKPISDKALENYIHNNIHNLAKEFPDGIWT